MGTRWIGDWWRRTEWWLGKTWTHDWWTANCGQGGGDYWAHAELMTSEGGQGVVSTASLGAFSIPSTSSTLDSNRSVGHLLSWVGLVDSVRAPELKLGVRCQQVKLSAIRKTGLSNFKTINYALYSPVVPLKTLLVLLRSVSVWPHNQVF